MIAIAAAKNATPISDQAKIQKLMFDDMSLNRGEWVGFQEHMIANGQSR